MKKLRKVIVLILVGLCAVFALIYVLYSLHSVDTFNKKQAVFEFYSQQRYVSDVNDKQSRVAYYIGIDKNRNLYAIGSNKSNCLYELWIYYECDPKTGYPTVGEDKIVNTMYIGEENMELVDFIPKPTVEIRKKLTEQEYMEILSLMEGVEDDWKLYADKETAFGHHAAQNYPLQFYKYNDKYYLIAGLMYGLCTGEDLGLSYKAYGETATNNIIRVMKLLDSYIDSSLDPEQFNCSKLRFRLGDKYKGVYSLPEDFINDEENES